MAVKKIIFQNFKSFKKCSVELKNFNVLIGANASGKSNFIDLFSFINDLIGYEIDDAISMHGGIEYFTNIKLGSKENFSLEIISEEDVLVGIDKINIEIEEKKYSLILGFDCNTNSKKIIEDKIVYKFNIEVNKKKHKGRVILENIDNYLNMKIDVPSHINVTETHLFPFLKNRMVLSSILLPYFFNFTSPFFAAPIIKLGEFRKISIFDIRPQMAKEATKILGRQTLSKDGSNLAIILKNILSDKTKKNTFDYLIRYLLPFINEMEIKKFADKSYFLTINENYYKKKYFPATILSDGTINIIALIILLYFEENYLTIIEEPERNLHITQIAKILNIMKESSTNKQILVSTQNADFIKLLDPTEILLVRRDQEGFSSIKTPESKKEINLFLKEVL